MAISPPAGSDLGDAQAETLTRAEVDALASAGAWYAKYHQRALAEIGDDESARAVARRQHFADLHRALDKLGVRIRRPPGLPG